MAGKWVELLKEIAPRARIAMLFNLLSATYADYWLNPFKAAAPSFSVEAIAAPVRDTSELEPVIAAQAREPNGGLIAMPDSFTDAHRVEHRWPLAIVSLPFIHSVSSLKLAAYCPTALTEPLIFGVRRRMWIAFSKARSQPSYQCKRQSSSNLSSISRPPARSALKSR
jgi:hypothetical protein